MENHKEPYGLVSYCPVHASIKKDREQLQFEHSISLKKFISQGLFLGIKQSDSPIHFSGSYGEALIKVVKAISSSIILTVQ